MTQQAKTRFDVNYYRAKVIADALTEAGQSICKKTVVRHARRELWPQRRGANCFLYAPPVLISQKAGLKPAPKVSPPGRCVKFFDLCTSAARQRTLARQQAVLHYRIMQTYGNLSTRQAWQATIAYFKALGFPFSIRSLRRWVYFYDQLGLNGLVEQKTGVVGRKRCHSRATMQIGNIALQVP